jgi:type VI secretion system secreted protein VgrG
MPILTDEKYSFVSKALPEDELAVVEFSGTEALSRPYEFHITLVSGNPNIDLADVLKNPATLTIRRPQDDVVFHGLLARFEQKHAFRQYVFYRTVLVPKFKRLALTFHNQIFLDKKLPDILSAVLKDGGLAEDDFELRVQKQYSSHEYVCQYQESHFAFVSRWMERDGMYYYFEQGEDKEKLIITDSALAHVDMPHGGEIKYSPPSGLEADHLEEVVRAVVMRRQMLPKEIVLRDYNYRKPSLDLTATARVKSTGRGRVYIYGEHYRTPEEGNALAAIRAEELLCREKELTGGGQVPFIRPGFTFTLEDHFRDDLNQKYLTISVKHQGSQAAYLTSELKEGLPEKEDRLFYKNEFQAIEASRQYRPSRVTPKPRFHGAMNAIIDAESSGEYAELDDMGRYKVVLPFDRSGRKDGKASAWLRMVQPYGGQGHGMHFPLRKGTEVLLTFVEGDPDRPIISGAVPNPDTPSPVNSDNQTMNAITSSSGNKIHIEDQEGSKRILMHSPTAGSFVRIGAHNDPDDEPKWGDKPEWETMEEEKDGIKLATTQGFDISAETKNTITLGESSSMVIGAQIKAALGPGYGVMVGHVMNTAASLQNDINIAAEWKIGPGLQEMQGNKKKVTPQKVSASAVRKSVKAKLEKMQAQVEKATGKLDKVKGNVNKAIEQANKAYGDVDKAIGECNETRGELNRATLQGEEAVGSITRAVGEANVAKEIVDEVVGEANEVATELTETAADYNSAVAERFRLNGIDSTL